MNNHPPSKTAIIWLVIITIFYWYWESQAEGNIRVDLLVIYPLMFFAYLLLLWQQFRYYALLISLGLMLMNVLFFMLSYDVFDKHPG